ncbi:adenosylcobinamide-GDP ribazoletransferase [Synechococcus sp. MIT S9504]|uniref:adenosylcobinamide-GDP ribazoletransferase n=1 Tax=Synechococcus sp. MIT S9504 TaxID=1801628 RepID=UPI001E626DCA|nr:adenosylcobinamide-GDP ribazoletransferase [Synechococcus sp. MIT S9504]
MNSVICAALRSVSPPWLRDLAGAWVFYSVLPGWPWPAPRFERIARFAPWIGAVIGGLMAALWFLLSALNWPPVATAPVVLALGLWLTGGLHLDGLMDTADGLAAGSSRCLEAMDDSRVGASGVQAAFIVLLLQFSALVQLAGFAPAALVFSAIFARVSPLWAMGRFGYLRAQDRGTAAFHRRNWCGWSEGSPTLLLLLAIGLLLWGLQPRLLIVWIGVALLGTLAALLPAEWLGRRLGGHSGDSYGATLMICETLTLLAFALLAPVLLPAA